MQAMVLGEPRSIEERPLHREEMAEPVPGPGELRLRVLACGICHTDLHTVEGELPPHKLPLVPGHQVVGTVDMVGPEVTRFKEGDIAGMAWLYSACGQCRYCHQGKENLCDGARFTGYDVDGGYAQYTIAQADFAYRVPQGFPPMQAAPLLCAGIIGYRALRLSEIGKGGRLGLFGFGASAHIAIQVAAYWGCEVYVFTRSQEHRNLALELGAAWAGGAQDKPPAKLDSAIIFAPAGRLVLDALRVLDKGGTLALAGIYMTPIPEMDYVKYLYQERTVRSVANSTRQDGEELLRLAGEIPLHTEVQAFQLDEANRVLQLLKEGRIQGAAVLHIAD